MNFSDMGNMMGIINAWNTFKSNHPKFPGFIQAVKKQGIKEDSIIEIAITDPDGNKVETNIKVKPSDLELLNTLANMSNK